MALDFRFSRPDDHKQIRDVFDDGFVFSRSRLTGDDWIREVEAGSGLLVDGDDDLVVAGLVTIVPDAPAGPTPPELLSEYMKVTHPGRTWAMLGPLGIRRTWRGHGLGLRMVTQAAAALADYDLHVALAEGFGESYADMAMVEDGYLVDDTGDFTVHRFAG